jgi:transposase-like protein
LEESDVTLKLRSYTREFKLKALLRWKAGEHVEAVARDVGVRADQLYRWRRKLEAGGPEALRGAGRLPRGWEPAASPPTSSEQRRIAELERKLGRQAVELDFLEGALQRIEVSRRPSDGPGGTASSPRSRR